MGLPSWYWQFSSSPTHAQGTPFASGTQSQTETAEGADHHRPASVLAVRGLTCIDGVLYLGMYVQSNPSKLSASKASFNADRSSVIKSADHGKTWSGSAEELLAKPMFPNKEFPTPFSVQYGKDYAGAVDDYVYVCSNDGGWNNFPSKWFEDGGKRMWIVQGGSFRGGGGYQFITQQIECVLP